MNEYSLILNSRHIAPLLESLRLHQTAVKNAPGSTEHDKAVMADLCRRAELLSDVINAGNNLAAVQEEYERYCAYGNAPDMAPVKVMARPL